MAFSPDPQPIRKQTPVTSADEFLTRGKLPFVGRERELAKLLAFWRETPNSDELRVCLLSGEAGIGKSRLVEALIPRIEEAAGVVLHIRIYPDSGTDLALLLANALSAPHDALHRETKGDLYSVVDAIRRMARLRAVLLVIEDVHLLDEHAAVGLGRLLELLAAERIAVLLLARPQELACRPLLERYLQEQFALAGLSQEEIADLCTGVMKGAPSAAVLSLLAEETLGNPLAIRSVLREVSAAAEAGGNGSLGHDALSARMRRRVDLLSEGLLTGLSRSERAAAERLAILGEVFSREAAAVMIEDAGQVIDALLAKGVLSIEAMPAVSIVGATTEQLLPGDYYNSALLPLAFTHTLVHRTLLAHAPVDCVDLPEAIGEGLLLYSHLPFMRLRLLPSTAVIEVEVLRRILIRIANLITQSTLDRSRIDDLVKAATDLAEHRIDGLLPDEQRIINAGLLTIRWAGTTGPVSSSMMDQWLEVTSEPQDKPLAFARLAALTNAYNDRNSTHPPEVGRRYLREIDDLLERFPAMHHSMSYSISLMYGVPEESYWNAAAFTHKSAGLEKVLADPMTSSELRAFALLQIGSQLLLFFSTPEELDHRREFQRQHFDDTDVLCPSEMDNLRFLQCIGEMDTVLQRCSRALPWMISHNSLINRRIIYHHQLLTRASLGLDLDQILDELCASIGTDRQAPGAFLMKVDMTRTGILCGRLEWARSVVAMIDDGEDLGLEAYSRVCLASDEQELEQAVLDGPNQGFGWECIELLGAVLRQTSDADITAATDAAAEVLSATTIRIDQFLLCRAVLRLIDVLRARIPDAADWCRFDALAHDAAINELEWLAERRIPAYMPPILDLLERHGTTAEVDIWRTRYERIHDDRLAELRPPPESTHLKITMLGTISIQEPGGEPQRLRGARAQALLATLVADRMLDTPLQLKELWQIVAGSDDPDKARIVTNTTIHRLREFLGHEAIITTTAASGGPSGETPRLNMDLVEVDLIEADRLVATAMEAMQSRALMRAVPALRKALEIIGGEVPFPGLYDEFFEAARTDFECRLRAAVVDVSRVLLREQDAAGAEMILRRAFDAMPDDEEISELLGETLVLLDRRTEAERVSMRARATATA